MLELLHTPFVGEFLGFNIFDGCCTYQSERIANPQGSKLLSNHPHE